MRVLRGVYAESTAWRSIAPWERYLARVHAAALKYPDAAFCLESAAALRGLTIFGEPPEVHIVLPTSATSRAFSGVRVHTADRMPAVEELGALLVTESAEIAVGIARLRHNAVGLAVAGSVIRADPSVTMTTLAELNASHLSSRGRRHAQWVIERLTAVPESPLEYVSLAVIEWLGFPAPSLQKWLIDPSGRRDDRVDFWWESCRIAGEADGDIKYGGEFGDARVALRDRRVRDARLIERGVSATAHWGWSDVIGSAQLRAALMAAGLRPSHPADTAQLHTLARTLAPRAARQP